MFPFNVVHRHALMWFLHGNILQLVDTDIKEESLKVSLNLFLFVFQPAILCYCYGITLVSLIRTSYSYE